MATNTPAAPTDEMVERQAKATATDIVWFRSHDARDHVIEICARSYEEIERRIVSALTAAMQHGQGIPDGWRTIESAPKDGTEILVSGGTYFDTSETFREDYPFTRVALVNWNESTQSFRRAAGTYDEWLVHAPTHWQPLPAAPTAPIRK